MEKTKSENTLESECKSPQLDLSKPSLLVAKLVGFEGQFRYFYILVERTVVRQVIAHYIECLLCVLYGEMSALDTNIRELS